MIANFFKSSNPPPGRRDVTPEEVLKLKSPTSKFLIPFDKSPPVQFLEYCIKDHASGEVYFEFGSSVNPSDCVPLSEIQVPDGTHPDELRTIHYQMTPKFLDSREISTSLVFGVGPQPIHQFRMIERHYIDNELLKS